VTADPARTVRLLLRAESEIALLDRTRPLEFAQEFQRLLGAWESGRHETPNLHYACGRPLEALKHRLAAIIEAGESDADEFGWLAGRASELLLEARMADAVGTAEFIALACSRFAPARGELASNLESTAREWIGEGAAAVQTEPRYRSDDRNARESLWCELSRQIGTLHLPIRLRVDDGLVSVAACGEDVVFIRGNAWLTARAAARIAEHEVSGHLLPRLAAKVRTDILRCGCAGANDDEEGRALLIERRLGLMDPWRRAELGARHLACTYLRRGATFRDAVRGLAGLGAPLEVALHSVLRASRGGGLGREIIYLPAMQRLGRAFESRPELEQWFRCGRASLAYAVTRQAAIRAA
jgi:hypothetical protein